MWCLPCLVLCLAPATPPRTAVRSFALLHRPRTSRCGSALPVRYTPRARVYSTCTTAPHAAVDATHWCAPLWCCCTCAHHRHAAVHCATHSTAPRLPHVPRPLRGVACTALPAPARYAVPCPSQPRQCSHLITHGYAAYAPTPAHGMDLPHACLPTYHLRPPACLPCLPPTYHYHLPSLPPAALPHPVFATAAHARRLYVPGLLPLCARAGWIGSRRRMRLRIFWTRCAWFARCTPRSRITLPAAGFRDAPRSTLRCCPPGAFYGAPHVRVCGRTRARHACWIWFCCYILM